MIHFDAGEFEDLTEPEREAHVNGLRAASMHCESVLSALNAEPTSEARIARLAVRFVMEAIRQDCESAYHVTERAQRAKEDP